MQLRNRILPALLCVVSLSSLLELHAQSDPTEYPTVYIEIYWDRLRDTTGETLPQLVPGSILPYPDKGVTQHLSDRTWFDVEVDATGKVTSVERATESSVGEGADILWQSARDGLKGLRFLPGTTDGKPSAKKIQISVLYDFRRKGDHNEPVEIAPIEDGSSERSPDLKTFEDMKAIDPEGYEAYRDLDFVPFATQVEWDREQLNELTKEHYPKVAVDGGIEGEVVLKVIVLKSGEMKSADVLKSSSPIFNKAATEIVGRLDFTPAMQNQVPINHAVILRINFRLERLETE